jgi:hypothetical protein
MSQLQKQMDHLKNHVQYPTDKSGVVAACNNMADYNAEDKAWFTQTLPDGKYGSADDVMKAIINKV